MRVILAEGLYHPGSHESIPRSLGRELLHRGNHSLGQGHGPFQGRELPLEQRHRQFEADKLLVPPGTNGQDGILLCAQLPAKLLHPPLENP